MPVSLKSRPHTAAARLRGRERARDRARLGTDFAAALSALEPGAWQGPIRSGLGWHLVHISHSVPGRLPILEAVREQVLRDWREARRRELQAQTYGRLRARYEITVGPDAAAPTPTDADIPSSVAGNR